MARAWLIACVCLLALLAHAPVASAQDEGGDKVEITDKARKLFAEGVDLLEDPQGPYYQEAYVAFQEAYQESPSPKILSNLGLCAMKLERDDEAIAAYRRYLEEVPDVDVSERLRINGDLAKLDARVAAISLTAKPDKAKLTDTRITPEGEKIVNKYEVSGGELGIMIHHGKHEVKLTAKGYESETWEFEVQPGDKHVKKIKLKKKGSGAGAAKPKPKPKPTPSPDPAPDPDPAAGDGGGDIFTAPVIVGMVATGLFVVGFAVTGGLALAAHGDYDSFELGGSRKQAEDTRATGEILNITTDVLLGCAVLAAGITTILIILNATGGDDGEEEASVQLLPSAGPYGGGAVLRATF